MIPESSVLPSYQAGTQDSYPNERTSLCSTKQEKDRVFIKKAHYVVALLFFFLIFSAVLGAVIDRALTSDNADPRVRNRIRHEWEIEQKQQQRNIETLEVKIQNLKHALEEIEDREKKDRWERETRRLYWHDIEGSQCEGYGLRMYTAHLANLSPSMDVVAACKITPITINGIAYETPLYCEDRGQSRGGVYGHWITKNNVICTTFWESVENKGCTAPKSGYRRIEASLAGLRSGDDSDKMCTTTPAVMYGEHFDHPMACLEGLFGGRWGIWDVPDRNCSEE